MEMMNEIDLDPRLEDTVFVVEADSFASHMLWSEHAKQGSVYSTLSPDAKRYQWEQDTMGLWYQIGELDNRPVAISFNWFKIDGHRVMFYECMSQVVDHKMVEEWLRRHCSPRCISGRLAHCDAMNFHHCLHEIDRLNE